MTDRTRELLLLIFGDSVCFVIAGWLTLFLRYLSWPSVERLEAHAGSFLLLMFVWLGIFYIAGLYDKHTVYLKSVLFSRIINAQVVNIIIAAFLFIIIPFGIAPKTNLFIYLAVSILVVTWWRLRVYPYFAPKRKQKAILVADGSDAVELVDEVNNNDRYSYSIVRIIDKHLAETTPNFEETLISFIAKHDIKIMIADPQSPYVERIMPTIFNLAFLKFEFTFLDFYKVYEDTFDRVALSALRYDWFITHVSQSKSIAYDVCKRIIDVIGSVFLLLVLGTLLPFIWIAKKIERRGDALFMWQKRIGRHNTPIEVIKLQTMDRNDADSATWTHEDSKIGNEITKVGAVLRKASIDELPQAWNILKGEMSLIGPRNDIAGLGARLAEEIPYYNIRNFVKPGVSGWAQTHQLYMGKNISPQSLEETRLRLAYDLYYVKNRSLLLDVEIALRTVKTLMSRFGLHLRLYK